MYYVRRRLAVLYGYRSRGLPASDWIFSVRAFIVIGLLSVLLWINFSVLQASFGHLFSDAYFFLV